MSASFGRLSAWLGGIFPHPALGAFSAAAFLAGPVYVLLAANATLVQSLAGGAYRLYSVSNMGSFAGLFAHPLVLEPFVPVRMQWLVLSVGTLAYAVLLGWCGRCAEGGTSIIQVAGKMPTPSVSAKTGAPHAVLYLALPAAGCFLLNAATAHVTENVAPLPLLWAVFLGGYLLSWTIGFSARGERLLPLWAALGVSAALGCAFMRGRAPLTAGRMAAGLASALALVVFACSALHAWLCRIRPSGSRLSRYNLALALGGAIGGALSGIVAPLVFDSVLEWPLALVLVAGLLLTCLWRQTEGIVRRWLPNRVPLVRNVLLALFVVVAFATGRGEWTARRDDLARGRSFYGTWRVYYDTLRNRYGKEVPAYCFEHGGTLHGLEAVDRIYRDEGTTYYGTEGGGLAFSLHPGYAAGHPVRAGLVGLGVGTMANYGRRGDFLRFYEICPQVADVAAKGPWFDYLHEAKSRVEIVMGDARQSLEAERTRGEPKWDVLVVDAYSGDSIPVQLVTEEAFRLYSERLAPGGVLALHLSNWHMDLVPAAKAAAKMLGMECVVTCAPPRRLTSLATWAFLSREPLRLPEGVATVPLAAVPDCHLPSDGCGGLLPFVRIML